MQESGSNMLKILERYIAKTIIVATALVALIITGVLLLMILLGELKSLGQGDYGLYQVFLYVILRSPSEFYKFSPVILLLGSIVGLSILSSHKELAVMRASGFSIRKIIYSVLMAAFLLVVTVTIFGEWFAPGLSYKAVVHKENAQNAGQAVVTSAGVWLHVDNSFIHVQQVVGRQLLEGVTRFEFDAKHRLQTAYYSKTLELEGDQWFMYNGVRTVFYPEQVKSQTFSKLLWDLPFNANLLNVGLIEPEEMSLRKLAKFTRYLESNGLQATQYEYQFWQRVLQPIASLLMIFLAIPFVLGGLSAATLGWRIMIGILVGFAFFIISAFLGQLCVVFQFPAFIAAVVPLLIFAIIGIILSKSLIRR